MFTLFPAPERLGNTPYVPITVAGLDIKPRSRSSVRGGAADPALLFG